MDSGISPRRDLCSPKAGRSCILRFFFAITALKRLLTKAFSILISSVTVYRERAPVDGCHLKEPSGSRRASVRRRSRAKALRSLMQTYERTRDCVALDVLVRRPLCASHCLVLAVAVLVSLPLQAMAQQPISPPAATPLSEVTQQVVVEELVDERNRIVEVRIEGNEVTPVSKLPKLATRAGQIFDPHVVSEDVRSLHRSKKFVDIHPKQVRVAEGIVVIFEVVERPMVGYVTIVGNSRVSSRTVKKKSEIDIGDSMDPYVVEEARRRIESFYQEKGYMHAKVTIVEGNKAGDRGAVFLIDEGRSQKSLWTSFVGNTIASDARLLTQIKTKPGVFWLLSGEVDREKIDQDVDTITAYYRSLGFFQAKVGRELQVVKGGGRDWVMLNFVISEGPRYAVRNVSFIGNTRFKGEFLDRDLKLKSGENFNQGKMDADLGLIRDIYGGRGFVFADIQADPRFLEEPGQIDLVYKITEGQRYRVGRINVHIRGEHPHTRHSTILNRLSLKPGDILDIRKLRDDERRLKASGLFLADASKGEAPKIVFTKPDNSTGDGQQVADESGSKGFRGQSPDSIDDGDAVIDLVLDAEPVSINQFQSPESNAGAQQQMTGGVPMKTRPTVPAASSFPRSTPPIPSLHSQERSKSSQTVLPVAGERPVWRGQNPGASPGWGGKPLQPTGPEALDYRRTAAPAPQAPVYVAQQPVAPGIVNPVVGSPFPGVAAPAAAFGGAIGVAPPIAQPDGMPAAPLNIFPGNDPYVVVDVDAEETQTGRLMLGAGVNSNAGLVGNIVIDEQNFDLFRLPRSWDDVRNGTAFRGAGQRFRLEAAPGTQLQRYSASFQEPYLFDTRIGLSTSASYYTRYFSDWAEERIGGRAGLGYQFNFAPNLSVNGGFRGESVSVYNGRSGVPAIQSMSGKSSLYGFRGGVIHDTRDSPFLPTQGHLASFEFEQVIGTYIYPRGIMEARQYFLLGERPDGSGRHTLGVGSVLGMTGPDTPAYENFFAGGYSTLRGFMFRGASPTQNGAIIGGPFEWLNTVEYMFPITADDSLRGVVFTDFGTVESSVAINNFRVAPGFGLRISLPAMGPAPIALDFAFPVTYAQTDSQQLFSFFVGFAR